MSTNPVENIPSDPVDPMELYLERIKPLLDDGKRKNHQLSGLARKKALTPERRSEIAKKAAQARWEKDPPLAKISKLAQNFFRDLIRAYYDTYSSVPQVLPGLCEPLILWDYEMQTIAAQRKAARAREREMQKLLGVAYDEPIV
jgi:hypothetical protein